MLGPTVNFHGHGDEAVTWLSTIPAVSVTFESVSHGRPYMSNCRLRQVFDLFFGIPFSGIRRMSAERTEHFFIADFGLPVLHEDLELKLAFL